jgi:signal transduction histidine kinase/DNA-binding response OmpR family regulator
MVSMRRPRILHLEDDHDLHRLLVLALRRAGLDVELVMVDRKEAFEAAVNDGGIDLVLSDRAMPGYGGLAALRHLKARDLHIPFVILSGSASSEGVEPSLAAGATEWLLKDDLPRVADTLRRLLSVASAPVRAEKSCPPDEAAVTLAWAVRQLTRSVSVADVVSVVPQAARLICEADGATIAFRCGDMVQHVGRDGLAPRFSGLDQPIGDCVSGRAMREGRPVAIDGPAAEGPGPGSPGSEGTTSSALAVPVGSGFPVAAIAVYRARPNPPFAWELELLAALADITALALERVGQGATRLFRDDSAAERRRASSESEAVARLMAHDLRNPLWQIRGFAELLRDEHALALGDAGRSVVAHLLQASGDLGGVIDGLVELAEISAEPLRPRVLDLGASARDVATTLSVGAPDRAVEWRFADDLQAYADPGLLRILLEKLLSNALRFTHGRALALVEVGGARSGEEPTTFFIRDNGEGFDPADTARLFLPFQRRHPTGEPARVSMGLAIVRRIVHRHGGEVWAEGARDAGAAFYFTLPAPR